MFLLLLAPSPTTGSPSELLIFDFTSLENFPTSYSLPTEDGPPRCRLTYGKPELDLSSFSFDGDRLNVILRMLSLCSKELPSLR